MDTPTPSPSPSPLALVACALLRVDARLAPLTHITTLLSELLDTSVLLTPAAAAASGSLRLFDRVQRRVAHNPRVDSALQAHWLALALQVALENDDLPMAQRIHAAHPEALFVHALITPTTKSFGSTLALALRYGSLETVQWVVANRRDRLCCSAGMQYFCAACLLSALPCLGDKDPFRIFLWLVEELRLVPIRTQSNVSKLWEFMIRSVDVVKWLYERRLLSRSMGELVLSRAVEDGRADVVQFLLATGYRIRGEKNIQLKLIHAACFGYVDVVEALLSSDQCRSITHKFQWSALDQEASKLLRWSNAWVNDRTNGNETIRDVIRTEASRSGNLQVLQWLHDEHDITPSMWHLQNHHKTEHTLLQVYKRMHQAGILKVTTDAIDTASRDGFREVVQWLHAHTTAGCTTNAMDDAAANGHLSIVQWLHLNRNEGCSKRALTSAARNGHLHVVQWLFTQQYELTVHVGEAKTNAATEGHLEVLVWLCRSEGGCPSCLTKAALRTSSPASPNVLRWLHTQDRSRCQDCADTAQLQVSLEPSTSEAAMNAALRGDLNLLTFLHELHPFQSSALWRPTTVQQIAQTGHVALLGWILEKVHRSGDAPDGSEERVDAAAWRDAQRDAHVCSGGDDGSVTVIQRLEIR